MDNRTAVLSVYVYDTDYNETNLGKVKFDLSEGDSVAYCHSVVQEQLGASLNQYESAIFMDDKMMELRDKYVNGESMAGLLSELGGIHTDDCDDEQAVLNLLVAKGHSIDWVGVELIGNEQEYTTLNTGFWEC